ncbi:hypothetical protein [Niabella hibiscisoli]|uniref:hypothetical protein n=1 Tax=Niabella hibiscisoli TaxID=1825928 RepID=UPI001F11517F|nr:hypothetical protein [Niabella hibiscisoli]MCH5718168.1 hypothetical protein [Niabella hibiscisoli]
MNNHLQTNLLEPQAAWHWYEKILFRFFFIFFTLFISLTSGAAFPIELASFMTPAANQFNKLVRWVSKHILKIPYEFEQNGHGSGDNTYMYVTLFIIFLIAVIATILWSAIDRNRKSYVKLYYWLTVLVRFYVAFILFSYGIVKIIKLQFPSPHVGRLMQPYGESSPMGLAWTFLGFSKGYNIFMGIAECAALLLLFRRTMTFGAIITLMTAANIMAVNYFFDVPVKILSTMLVVMTAFLLAHDIKRLCLFLFSGKPVSLPTIKAPVLSKKWMKFTKLTAKILLIAATLIPKISYTLSANKEYGENAPTYTYLGFYEVTRFVVNNKELPANSADSSRWKHLNIRSQRPAAIRFMTDSLKSYKYKFVYGKENYIELTPIGEPASTKKTLKIGSDSNGITSLSGRFDADSVQIFLRKKNPDEFLLMNRGFNWINERPFNR